MNSKIIPNKIEMFLHNDWLLGLEKESKRIIVFPFLEVRRRKSIVTCKGNSGGARTILGGGGYWQTDFIQIDPPLILL